MAEIAGLVVGGIPIAIWALEKYAEPLEAFSHYAVFIGEFQADLKVQLRILQTTLYNIGLPGNPTNNELRECFETKFPDISHELMSMLHRMDETTGTLLKALDVDANGKPDVLPDKIQWEWRRVKRSLNAKKRDKLVSDLRHWNEDLRRCLEKTEVPSQDDTGKVQDLKRRFSMARSDTIRKYLASFHRALELGFRCSCSTPHQAAIDLDWASYESNSARTIKVALSYEAGSQHQGQGLWRKLGITTETITEAGEQTQNLLDPQSPAPVTSPRLLTPSSPVHARGPSPNLSLRFKVARFGFGRSLSRTPSPSPVPQTPPTGLSALDRATVVQPPKSPQITSLCVALCSQNDPWPLKRFLKDRDENQTRHYSIHHHRVDSPNIVKTVPLKSLLSPREPRTQRTNPYLALSAKERFGIAATVAWSVLHLSCGPWLDERDWDQRQMGMFVEKTCNGKEMFSRRPCVSYVFSPRTGHEEPLADNLSHFVPNRTVFALGILLIELCIREPVSKLRTDDEEASSLVDDYSLALSKLDEVYLIAGDSYGNATQRCIKFSFEGRDMHNDFEFSTFRQQFYEVVVAPVQATYLAFPDSSRRL